MPSEKKKLSKPSRVTSRKAVSLTAKKSATGATFFERVRTPARVTSRRPGRRPPKGTDRTATGVRKTGTRRRDDTFEPGLVFVAMSFLSPGSAAAFDAIKRACDRLKLNARRVDDNVGSGFIILEIVDLIERAELIVIDLTDGRPNVYYELGYAHGVGNAPSNVFLVAKTGTELHFDIAGLRVRFYKSRHELHKLVYDNLSAMLKAARRG